jgi:ribosomal protein L34E
VSISYTVDVHCDRCGDWIHGITSYKPNTARLVLSAVERAEWSRDLKSTYADLCPKCLQEARKEPK